MKRHVISLLVAVNLMLALALAYFWVDQNGQWRNIHWLAPTPVKADLGSLPVSLQQSADTNTSHFVAIGDKPLFSPSRRQPPPPPPPAPPPPPDPFADIELFGVFSGEGVTGIMARIEGKMRRVKVTELVGAWTLKAVDDRDVTFVNGDQTRVLRLIARKAPPRPVVAANGSGVPISASLQAQKQQNEIEGRERMTRINALRAKSGLPPLPP
jgi:hypothetical protein